MRAAGLKTFFAGQESKAGYILSAAMAYVRSLAASALGIDPDDLTWRQIALVMKHGHQDVLLLGELDLDRASAMGNAYLAKHDLAFSSMLSGKVISTLAALLVADVFHGQRCFQRALLFPRQSK